RSRVSILLPSTSLFRSVQHLVHDRGDHRTESGPGDHTDGEVHCVAAGDQLFEPVEHDCLLLLGSYPPGTTTARNEDTPLAPDKRLASSAVTATTTAPVASVEETSSRPFDSWPCPSTLNTSAPLVISSASAAPR